MKQFAALISVLVKQKYKLGGGRKSSGIIAAYCVVGALLAALLGAMCWGLWIIAPDFAALGKSAELPHFILSIVSMVIVFLGMISMIGYVYFNNDSEFLASLPIKPSRVFAAKISVVLIEEIIFAFAVCTAPLIVAGISMGMGALYYVMIPFMIILVPVIPLLIVSILAIPAMYVVSFFRSRGVITSIALILIFGLFYGGYFLITQNIQKLPGADVTGGILSGVQPFIYMFYPMYHLCRLAAGVYYTGLGQAASYAVSAAIAIGGTALVLAISLTASSLFYYRGVAAQLENRKARAAAGGSYKHENSIKALINKEFKEIIRTPAVAFQCFGLVIISPIVVFISLSSGGAELANSPVMAYMPTYMGIMMCSMFGAGINVAATTCISREGTNFYYLKILPIDYDKLISAKKRLYLTTNVIAAGLTYLATLIMGGNPLYLLASLVYIGGFAYAFVCFAMNMDINNPKLVWTTATEVFKGNKTSTVSTLAGLGIALATSTPAMVFGMIFGSIVWVNYLIFAVLGALAIAAAAIMHKVLHKNIVQRINLIE